jgi:hypothetical protein
MTVYSNVVSVIDGLHIGDNAVIALPDNLPAFRKYLSEISKRQNKRFTTKVINNQLHILRVQYSNIYSKEVENK